MGSPGIIQQAFTAGSAFTSFIAHGFKTTNPEQYKARLEVCESCKVRSDHKCTKCGCFITLKAAAPQFKCPLNLWDLETREPPPITSAFQKIFCIVMEDEEKRWESFTRNLIEWPFHSVVKYPAVAGNKFRPPSWWCAGKPAWGCYRSHLQIIEKCINHNINSVLILEVDAQLIPGFIGKFTEFWNDLPSNWEMIYLGGQHLSMDKHPPVQISDHVWKPWNVNRTHAYALQGSGLHKVYDHLLRRDWKRRHHIDHHYGRLHQSGKINLYCPKSWLIGQRGGFSRIAFKQFPDREWSSADESNADLLKERPYVVVIGNHSSGSSALAGVLHHLGVYFGERLGGYYGSNPEKNCGFESKRLTEICEDAAPFLSVATRRKKAVMYNSLKRYLIRLQIDTPDEQWPGIKYPQLSVFCDQIFNLIGRNMLVIHADRPLEDSIASMVRRTGKSVVRIESHMQWLHNEKMRLLNKCKHLSVRYNDLIKTTDMVVEQLADALVEEGLPRPTQEQIQKAISYVKPEMRHI
ncbi:MAG: DUF6171 family protein [bacterium]